MESSIAYIIILNWNGAADTLQCVASLQKLDHRRFVIFVCDNASRAADVHTLRSGLRRLVAAENWGEKSVADIESKGNPAHPWTPGSIVLVHTGSNLGFAGGVNVGLRYALSQADMDYAWILNNDTEVDRFALTAMLDRMAEDGNMGICGSSLIYHADRSKVQALGGATYHPFRGQSRAMGAFSSAQDIPSDSTLIEAKLDYVVGASMLVSRRFLEKVGLMDERYFLYSEEHDWAHRGRQLGFRLGWAPGALVFHKHGATIGTNASGGSELSLYYLYRNKALFTAMHFRHLLPLVLPSLAWDGLKFLLKGKPGKALAIFKGLAAFLAGKTGPSYSG